MHSESPDRRSCRGAMHRSGVDLHRHGHQRNQAGRLEPHPGRHLPLFHAGGHRQCRPAPDPSPPGLQAGRTGRRLHADVAGQHPAGYRVLGQGPAGHHGGLLLRHPREQLAGRGAALPAGLAHSPGGGGHRGILRGKFHWDGPLEGLGSPSVPLARLRLGALPGDGLPDGDRAAAVGGARTPALPHGAVASCHDRGRHRPDIANHAAVPQRPYVAGFRRSFRGGNGQCDPQLLRLRPLW